MGSIATVHTHEVKHRMGTAISWWKGGLYEDDPRRKRVGLRE